MTDFLNLGDLIEALKRMPFDENLRIAMPSYAVPCGVHSYRGFYEDLAIGWDETPRTVKNVISILEAAVGTTFTGWKGGRFRMGPESRIWISQPGRSSGARVTGVDQDDGNVFLVYAMRAFSR